MQDRRIGSRAAGHAGGKPCDSCAELLWAAARKIYMPDAATPLKIQKTENFHAAAGGGLLSGQACICYNCYNQFDNNTKGRTVALCRIFKGADAWRQSGFGALS